MRAAVRAFADKGIPSPWYLTFGFWYLWSPQFGLSDSEVLAGFHASSGFVSQGRIVLFVAYIVGVALVGLFGRFTIPFRAHRRILTVATLTLSVSALATGLVGLGAASGEALFVGSVLRGSTAWLMLFAWLEMLRGMSGRRAGMVISGALVVNALASISVMLLARAVPIAAVAILTLLPLASLYGLTRLWERPSDTRGIRSSAETLRGASLVLLLGVSAANGVALGVILEHMSVVAGPLSTFSFGVAALVFLCGFWLSSEDLDLGGWFRLTLVFVAAEFVILPFLGGSNPVVARTAGGVAWAALVLFTSIIFTDVVFRAPGSPLLVGLLGCAHVVGILGGILLLPSHFQETLSVGQLSVVSLAVVALLAVGYLPSRRSWLSPWGFPTFVEPESRDAFCERRCGEIASAHGLTRREVEVLVLLAKGRSKEEIGRSLYVSALTVKTHVQHIFAKLGVHTQQELVDLVGVVDAPGEQGPSST